MRKFILKRLLISVVVLFFVGLIIYLLIRSLPTNYIETVARDLSSKQGAMPYAQMLEQLKVSYGLNVGVIQGYLGWFFRAITGDFQNSWLYSIPVIAKFSQVIWYSVLLGSMSFVIYTIIAVPLGIISARRQYSLTDYSITVGALIGISLPTFFVATVLKIVFASKLGWLDLYGIVSRDHLTMTPTGQIVDILKHLILPTATLVIISVGSLMRFTRTNMLEVLSADYIRTARAKGVPERRVIYHHAFRNTLIPLVTILGGTLPGLFAGALITETLFQIPGIGFTSYICLTQGDIPFAMFYLVFAASLTLLGNLIADVLYAVVDPRVRLS